MEKRSRDRTVIVVTVVGSSALLATVMTLLIGSVHTWIDDLQDAMHARFDGLDARFDDGIDDLNGRVSN